MRAIFIDRDGTLNLEPPEEVVASPTDVTLHSNVVEGLKIIAGLDYKIFILTNQIGIARKRITTDQFWAVNQKVIELIAPSGVEISKTYFCPHEPADNCECRIPKTGMIKQLLADYPDLDLSNSWVIGDRLSDVGLARAIGSRMILVDMADKYTDETTEYVARDLLDAAQIIQIQS